MSARSGYQRVLDGECVDGWRLVLRREQLIGDATSRHVVLPLDWSDSRRAEEERAARLGGGGRLVIRTHDCLPGDRERVTLRRYCLWRPGTNAVLLKMVRRVNRWSLERSVLLTVDGWIATVYSDRSSARCRLILTDARRPQAQSRLFTLLGPAVGCGVSLIYLDQSIGRLLLVFARYVHSDDQSEAGLRVELIVSGYEWPLRPRRPIVSISEQSISVPAARRNGRLTFWSDEQALVCVVSQYLSARPPPVCLRFAPGRGWWVGEFRQWLDARRHVSAQLRVWRSFQTLDVPDDSYWRIDVGGQRIFDMCPIDDVWYVTTEQGVLGRRTSAPLLRTLAIERLLGASDIIRRPPTPDALRDLVGFPAVVADDHDAQEETSVLVDD